MKKMINTAAFFCAAAAVLFSVSCSSHQPQEQNRTVSVSGTGVVYTTPDKAVIVLSVITANKDAAAAAADNAAKMTSVQDALIGAGVIKDDISTANYNIYQDSNWNNGKHITGDYRVSNEITAILHKPDTAGTVIDAAVKAGANDLSSLSFDVTDAEKPAKQARILAVRHAEETAALLASSSGAELGKVLTITEDAETSYRPVAMMAKAYAYSDSNASTPVAAGKSQVTVTVHVTYALK